MYVSLQDPGHPTRFLHWMVFEDEAARDRHTSTPWVREFTDVIYPECLAPVEFTTYDEVALA